MQKGKVYRNKIYAGLLIKISNEEYIFHKILNYDCAKMKKII